MGPWLAAFCLLSLAAWGTLASAQQQAPPVNLPPPEPEKLAPPAPVKVESTLPKWKAGQADPLKPPVEILKPPTELPKQPIAKAPTDPTKEASKAPCPPGLSGKAAEQCDQNVPGVPCPTPKDLEEQKKYVDKLIDPNNTLTMYQGRTRLMLLKETPKRVQIADETIVDSALLDPMAKELSLLAKKIGNTVLNLWFTDPADKSRLTVISYLIRVVPDPEIKASYERLAAEINRAFPDSRVCLFLVGDKLAVQGQAKDVAEAAQILRIARSVAPRVDETKLPYSVAVSVDSASASRDRLRDLVDAAGPTIINMLRVPGEQQVMLKVTVAEINRAAARSIGLNFSYNNGHGFAIANTTGNIAGTTVGTGLGVIQGSNVVGNQAINSLNQVANNIPVIADNGRLTLAIDALRNLTYARTLAEPSLLTLDGQTAVLQAGGKFPFPIVTGATSIGLQGVEFQNFGVQLSFTPYITDRDRIRLSLSAEVSTRDLSLGTIINGASVPGLNTRNFQTVVELRHGETFAVAGLIQNNLGAQASRIPFFGDLPIIGRVLGFDQLNAGEQELVVLVTPVLAHPLHNEEITPLPGSDLFEPGDLEFYLLGRLESRRAYDYRSPVRTDIGRMASYHRCEQIYIFGPSGNSEMPSSLPAQNTGNGK
jgi:pilus assembly protein CpaC